MIAILMVAVIRLILYIDLIFTDRLGPHHLNNNDGKTINTMVFKIHSFICFFHTK
ncbi:unnamed protein product [Gongylonema pulchrum]|uniref:Uncharacterized protein n=1 Tax=Gongylonema pulchrum TaxID=637853 RepID=A0A183DKK7_9BILA|nr:unnamed protein product [Gongylonema pulchrum]